MSDRRVYKYEIDPFNQPTIIALPSASKVLLAGVQPKPFTDDRAFCIWVELDTHEILLEKREFFVIPTGFETVPDQASHVQSFIHNDSGTVWHIYERSS